MSGRATVFVQFNRTKSSRVRILFLTGYTLNSGSESVDYPVDYPNSLSTIPTKFETKIRKCEGDSLLRLTVTNFQVRLAASPGRL
jgi:hypothetical protein